MNYTDVPNARFLSAQSPLDSKNHVNTLAELKDLGENAFKAYTYYKGMLIYCHENNTRYEWTDDLTDKKKLLTKDFIYPNGINYNEFIYSNKRFNFIPFKTSSNIYISDKEIKTFVVNFTPNQLRLNNGLIQHNKNTELITDIKIVFPNKIYTEKCPVSFSIQEAMLFNIIEEFEIINQNVISIKNFNNYQNITGDDNICLIVNYT